MTYRGKVQGGVVVLAQGTSLPDGTEVEVAPIVASEPQAESGSTIWQRLTALGREAEARPTDLPSDLAVNHDHYLHGLPKRP